jgi:diacylglycerol kinase (ATP)
MTSKNPTDQAAGPDPLQSTLSVMRIINAFRYSMSGFAAAFRHEAAFRQELLFVVPAFCVLWFLPVTAVEKVLLLASVLLVLIVELLNSAVEAVVDRVSEERHPLSGRAKDFGSAAVLLSLILMFATWILIAGPVLMSLLR